MPLGAALPGSAERNPSGIPSAAIWRSQRFSQFQLSFSAKPQRASRSFDNIRSATGTALNKYEGSGEFINARTDAQIFVQFARRDGARDILVGSENQSLPCYFLHLLRTFESSNDP